MHTKFLKTVLVVMFAIIGMSSIAQPRIPKEKRAAILTPEYYTPWIGASFFTIANADNLRRRLREHLRNLKDCVENEEKDLSKHIQHCSRYWYIRYFGAYVYTFNCLKNTQDAKNLESELIWHFYEKYRSFPVGNGARSFGRA